MNCLLCHKFILDDNFNKIYRSPRVRRQYGIASGFYLMWRGQVVLVGWDLVIPCHDMWIPFVWSVNKDTFEVNHMSLLYTMVRQCHSSIVGVNNWGDYVNKCCWIGDILSTFEWQNEFTIEWYRLILWYVFIYFVYYLYNYLNCIK